MKNSKRKVYHLSHTDLDGYSCQLITKRCFEDISYYNSNYGSEIDSRIETILRRIYMEGGEDNLILITDLTQKDRDTAAGSSQDGAGVCGYLRLVPFGYDPMRNKDHL